MKKILEYESNDIIKIKTAVLKLVKEYGTVRFFFFKTFPDGARYRSDGTKFGFERLKWDGNKDKVSGTSHFGIEISWGSLDKFTNEDWYKMLNMILNEKTMTIARTPTMDADKIIAAFQRTLGNVKLDLLFNINKLSYGIPFKFSNGVEMTYSYADEELANREGQRTLTIFHKIMKAMKPTAYANIRSKKAWEDWIKALQGSTYGPIHT